MHLVSTIFIACETGVRYVALLQPCPARSFVDARTLCIDLTSGGRCQSLTMVVDVVRLFPLSRCVQHSDNSTKSLTPRSPAPQYRRSPLSPFVQKGLREGTRFVASRIEHVSPITVFTHVQTLRRLDLRSTVTVGQE